MGSPAPLSVAIVVALVVSACGGDDTDTSAPASEPPSPSAPTTASQADTDGVFPDVLEVSATQSDDETWTFNVTISSPYDAPDRYADAWRIVAADGRQLGVRELLHDHAGEQPFTRSLAGVEIPNGVTEVTVQARDQLNGWGGATVVFALD